eukprot:5899167-Prymnesium_polylepis.1
MQFHSVCTHCRFSRTSLDHTIQSVRTRPHDAIKTRSQAAPGPHTMHMRHMQAHNLAASPTRHADSGEAACR